MRFANGLMNETNKLIVETMEKLPEIRTTQLQMADGAQWDALTDQQVRPCAIASHLARVLYLFPSRQSWTD